jgi:predicted RecA/RadA family phage recombinase
MSSPLYKQYVAQAAIAPYRIVVPGAAAGQVVQASSAAGLSTGISWDVSPLTGERVDICHAGIHVVEAGAAFAAGAALTADANGRAVAAATAGNRVVGVALEAAVASGDLVNVIVNPGVF